MTCWFDITGVESASEFEDKIISAITESSYVLFALSDNSMRSECAKDEGKLTEADHFILEIVENGSPEDKGKIRRYTRVTSEE